MVNVLLAATHSNSFTTCGLRGQGAGMVNVLLAASPATRSRPRAIKGQEPGLVDVLLQPTEQTRSRRKAEVVNELLWVAGPKERSPALAPGPLCASVRPGNSTCVTDVTDVVNFSNRNSGRCVCPVNSTFVTI